MGIDFLSKLDETNSTKDEKTGKFILKIPKLELEDELEINSTFQISSNCNTVIICSKLTLTSVKDSSFENITFECSVRVDDSENIRFTNCSFQKANSGLGALTFNNTKSASISHINVTDIGEIPGIYLTSNSFVSADNLLIHDIAESLLVCNSESRIYLKDSNLNHTKANGIYSSGGSYLHIENCTISDTDYPAIYFSGSTGVIKNNIVKNVSQNGISLNSSKTIEVIGNNVTKVSGSAISFLDGSTGKAIGNIIKEVEGNGIYINGGSEVEVIDNDISHNDYPGIAVLMKSNATLLRNRVSNITYSGICVRGACEAKLIENHIFDIKECGVSISDTEKCEISNCTIENCSIGSCEAYNGSKVTFSHNKISKIKEYAFIVYTSAFMKVEGNEIKNVGKAMVKLLYKGGGEFINNQLFECPNLKDGHTSSQYFFDRNSGFKGLTNIKDKKSDEVLLDDPFVDVNTMCVKCKKNPRNCFIFDCGHRIFCKDCAEAAMKNKETCPLCRFPIVKVTEGFQTNNDEDENTCILCFENPTDCIVTPCGHMGFCKNCLDKWFKSNKMCPICRNEPSNFKNIINIMD